jgi:hypothetical protein
MPLEVLDLISSAMRLINVLADGEVPTASMAQDALFVLQSMVDSWQAERLMIFTIPRNVYTLTAGQQTYNLGLNPPNAWDFNAPRPARIERMGIIWLGNAAQPLELPLQYLTVAQWQEIPVKNITSSLPQYCWDDDNFPFRGLNFWPIPNVNDQITIYPWTAITTPATLTTQLAFPPGYLQAFRYNLAVMLAAEFPPVPDSVLSTVAAIANESKRVVKAMNTPMTDLRCDPALTPLGDRYLYNWISDMPCGR